MNLNLVVFLFILLLLLSAFFSASETAYFNLQRIRLNHLAASGDHRAKRVARLRDEPEKFLATILLGNNLVNTAVGALGTMVAISVLGSDQQGLSVAVATGAVTVALVVLGEATPKTLASRHSEFLAFLFVRLWEIVEWVLFPLALVLYSISRLLTWPFQSGHGARPLISKEELRSLIRTGAREGAVEETQAQIITQAFRFGDQKAQDIMTPRPEIVWVNRTATLREFLDIYKENLHTRFPVYDEEADNVVGILYLKEIVKAMAEGRVREGDGILPYVHSGHFYPETKPVDDLLVEMRTAGLQMVMLVNEYGGIAGLLTMRQVVSELVGRITDEEHEPEVRPIDEKTTQVDASLRVEEANERLGLDLPLGDYDTLAGFILSQLGHVPGEGEQVRYNNLLLVVKEMKGVRIERIQVIKV